MPQESRSRILAATSTEQLLNGQAADILSILFILCVVVVALILYPDLPQRVPTHWNAAGEIDGYMNKPWGVIVLPLAAVFTVVLMKIIPRISPRVKKQGNFRRALSLFQVLMVGFLSGVSILVLLAANGTAVRMNESIIAGVGLLFFAIGIILPRVGQNYFMGIRTPWTLASEDVWDRTHRHAGPLFMLLGFALLLSAFLNVSIAWFIGSILLLVLWLVVYSYRVHRRVEREKQR